MKRQFKKLLTIAGILLLLGLPSIGFAARTSNYFNLNSGIVHPNSDAYDFSVGGQTTSAPLYVDVSEDIVYMGELNVTTTTIDVLIVNTTASSTTFLAGDGTAAAPSITFASDTNTGFYRYSTDKIGISTGGTGQFYFDTSGFYSTHSNAPAILYEAPTATNPVFSFATDKDTGIGYDPTGAISLIDDGVQAMKVASTSVQVVDGTASVPAYSFLSDPNTGFYSAGANSLGIGIDGTARYYVNVDGLQTLTAGGFYLRRNVGSNILPVHSFLGDENTGIGRNSADELDLIAGGLGGLRIDFNELEVQPLMTLATGPIELEEDSGAVTAINLPVSSTPSDGDEMSMSFSIDSNAVLIVKALADGVGGIDTKSLEVTGDFIVNTDLLFVDESADMIGIATTTPATLLDIFSTGTTTITIDSNSATQGACLKLSDFDSADYTYCVVADGTMTCSTTSCE